MRPLVKRVVGSAILIGFFGSIFTVEARRHGIVDTAIGFGLVLGVTALLVLAVYLITSDL